MNRNERLWPAIVLASVAALAASAAAGVESPLRVLLACWFLLACPGLALAPLLAGGDSARIWTVALSLSVALDVLVGLAFLYAGLWSPAAIAALLGGISVAGATLQLARSEGFRR